MSFTRLSLLSMRVIFRMYTNQPALKPLYTNLKPKENSVSLLCPTVYKFIRTSTIINLNYSLHFLSLRLKTQVSLQPGAPPFGLTR